MSVGIGKGWSSLDLNLIARLVEFLAENPSTRNEEIAEGLGLNTYKIVGLKRLAKFLGLQKNNSLTSLGTLIHKEDPYFQKVGTLCSFHFILCSNRNAAVWHSASNIFIPRNKVFTRDKLKEALKTKGIQQTSHFNNDVGLFLNGYTSSQYYALQKLGYLSLIGHQFNAKPIDKVPPLVLGYALYQQRTQSAATSTISINNLLSNDGQIGKVFLLHRDLLLDKLRVLESQGIIGITQIATLDNITFTNVDDPLSMLTAYYQESI
ncbi:MAG: hypothetical protein CL608_26220 [Anaerolineaceae bacterium]|nr:hypothetical protein [Anaerolineaceae bacterium]